MTFSLSIFIDQKSFSLLHTLILFSVLSPIDTKVTHLQARPDNPNPFVSFIPIRFKQSLVYP